MPDNRTVAQCVLETPLSVILSRMASSRLARKIMGADCICINKTETSFFTKKVLKRILNLIKHY